MFHMLTTPNRTIRLSFEPLESRNAPTVVPIGGEFQVNTFSTNEQIRPSVAMDHAGDFVVTWTSNGQDGSNTGVYAQRFDAAGVPQGSEFQVNSYTTGNQQLSSVAMDQTGDFVAAWQSISQGPDGIDVYAQRYNSTGLPQGNEFLANTFFFDFQYLPEVAMNSAGAFVIMWSSYQDFTTGLNFGVYAQRYDAAGAPQGGEFRVNSYTTNDQYGSAVAMDEAGNFVVVWQSQGQDDPNFAGVYAQRYSAAGVPQGGEFHVNSFTTAHQHNADVAMDADGDFVVVWTSGLWDGFGQDGSAYGIYAQRYDSAGVPQGGEFRVNTYTIGSQSDPAVAMDADGDFVIAWSSKLQDGSGYGVYAQAYLADGTTDGNEFRVNTYTTNNQQSATIAMDADGNIVVAWEGYGDQDGNVSGIFAQRYRLDSSPRVTGVEVNSGATQRSRVTELAVTFSTQVTFATTPGAAFTLTRNSDGTPVNFTATPIVVGGVTVVTLNSFSDIATQFGSLSDGRYTLTALSSQLSAGGMALDGNGDGIAGDDYLLIGNPTNGLFRLFGDGDGDGVVTSGDFVLFRQTYATSINLAFDFNDNGMIDSDEFVEFRKRFGLSIVP